MDFIKDIITPIEKLIGNQTFSRARTNFDLKFIEKQKQNASNIFEVSFKKGPTTSRAKKRKATETVITCQFGCEVSNLRHQN